MNRKLYGLILILALIAMHVNAYAYVMETSLNDKEVVESIVYHGNVKSKKFHRPSCRYYDCRNCTAIFESREDAIEAGYVPCKVCRP